MSTAGNKKATITVFTPAYNRAHTLSRTFDSLCNQDCKDFIWLIIDDGSKDNTAELVKEWMRQDNGFKIRYIYKENGGMHTAHNIAYENIDTELNVCIDSDDRLANGAISTILAKWDEIKNDNRFAGIVALDADFNGNVIGKGFEKDCHETTLSNYYAKGGAGDKKLIYRTDVIKEYPPYPVFENEKYVGLGSLYTLIDQKYTLAVLDKVVCEVEYQGDGSTHTMYKQYLANPRGFAYIRRIGLTYSHSFPYLCKTAIHYVSSCLIARDFKDLFNVPHKLLVALMFPFGILWTLYVYYRGHKQ